MQKLTTTCILLGLSVSIFAQNNLPSAEEVLTKSIAFHDPEGIWETFEGGLKLESSRPNGSSYQVAVHLNIPNGDCRMESVRDGKELVSGIKDGTCFATVDGKSDLSEEQQKKLRLTCERTTMMRDYYAYLYGLPMKLRDPGTHIRPEVKFDMFLGKVCYELKITYDPEVGGDIWYVYVDRENYEMIGYRFYHDEQKNDGEYITLEGLQTVQSMKLPKTRKWYYNRDGGYLGMDELLD